MLFMKSAKGFLKSLKKRLPGIYFGKHISSVPRGSVIIFPVSTRSVSCGLAGIVSYRKRPHAKEADDHKNTVSLLRQIQEASPEIQSSGKIIELARLFKTDSNLFALYRDQDARKELEKTAVTVSSRIKKLEKEIKGFIGRVEADRAEQQNRALEELKDALWCMEKEVLLNLDRIENLLGQKKEGTGFERFRILKKVNAVLNSIDRLEVRGRDSAGISVIFYFNRDVFKKITDELKEKGLAEDFDKRNRRSLLSNRGIDTNECGDTGDCVSIAVTYKVAAEIGSLGDNIAFIRREIRSDAIIHILTNHPNLGFSILSHTRWASVGGITEANCHPVDNKCESDKAAGNGIIHACLNGDIDNYLEIKKALETSLGPVHPEITTDTKIIPLLVSDYYNKGHKIGEAFRLAVNDFEGSHAICMHTDLAPGRLFLAQKGSGQAIFVGIAEDHYIAASEIYGLVEETPFYIKLEGKAEGQIVVLDQDSTGRLEGISAFSYDGKEYPVTEEAVKRTEITSRDIDRQNFPHFFLKEICESPDSVERTLSNRFRISDNGKYYSIFMDKCSVPDALQKAIQAEDEAGPCIRRIFFVGQGTAGVAAQACANLWEYYLKDPRIQVRGMKSSELSGFKLYGQADMKDALVIAISQSGTTTDTNRTVDLAVERGARTIAIVNRRDSDITFKTEGVVYTSSGRDIEMSVASTKAFYSQIVAGALLGLFVADLRKRRDKDFISEEIRQLLQLPGQMRKVLDIREGIKRSAQRLAVTKTYWAAVGSGPNRASADEIRIKLSELCYKTISADYIEDKKHIDLSAEPLIIVCAAGTSGNVITDIIKDTAIFNAHKASSVIIADEGEERFSPYAEDVFHVPAVSPHLAPVMNTLAGHLWGYYAALAIHEYSRLFFDFRTRLERLIADLKSNGLSLTEIVLEKKFREEVAAFYLEFRQKGNRLSAPLGSAAISDIILLLKYLSGKLPASDFELDFGIKGTAVNMIDRLFSAVSDIVNQLARPIDAIKHQAKTVTVGTSRVEERLHGILFDHIRELGFVESQILNRNILVLKHFQNIVSKIKGTTIYRISGLSLLGEPDESTRIELIEKRGTSKNLQSRVEKHNRLTGTKRIIVEKGNVYIGKGLKDERSILIIPLISDSPAAPNLIEYLLLFEIDFKVDVEREKKIMALGGKFDHIKNIIIEQGIFWQDELIDSIPINELFGRSAEKIAETIISRRL